MVLENLTADVIFEEERQEERRQEERRQEGEVVEATMDQQEEVPLQNKFAQRRAQLMAAKAVLPTLVQTPRSLPFQENLRAELTK